MRLDGPKGSGPEPTLRLRNLPNSPKSGKAKSPQAPKGDSAPSDSLTTAFELLAENDRRAATYEPGRIRANLENGYEALVQFKDSENKGFVLALRDEAEVSEYAALRTGAGLDDKTKEQYSSLKDAGDKGTRFFFERGGKNLRTDAAGALIALKRGSRVVLQRGDGEVETHKDTGKATSFLANLDGEGAKNLKLVQGAREAGVSLSPKASPDGPQSKMSMIKAALGGASGELELDSKLVSALESQGEVLASFDKDSRPLKLPVLLRKEDIEAAAKWDDAPSPEIAKFKDDFGKLTEDKMILMTHVQDGPMKGVVARADDRATYFQLSQGKRVVALDAKGGLHELKNLEDFDRLKDTGRAAPPDATPFDGSNTPSDNLMMVYEVSAFDPVKKGNYGDLPLRMTAVPSSEQMDVVMMRSDLPEKRNLLVERVQDGELQEIKRLDPKLAMSEPKVLEDFVYETVKSNMSDGKIRFLVGGHGGAEKGLLPDGEHNNAQANSAMPVDEFAGAISKALDRVEKETGERPKIANMMLVSCLMGNTSFINALAKTGDIETLVASPELMAGSNPLDTFKYLADPKTSKASAVEYAEYLVDEWSKAPAMIGGSVEDMRHAPTIGAYDLSPEKAERFEKALNGFFTAALEERKYAAVLKENIAKAPSYGMNPVMNILFDVDDRDLLQFLDHSSKDARIDSPKLKKAIQELRAATEAQVIGQKVAENYEGRRGPSLYLPLDKWDANKEMSETELLKNGKYSEFMEMIFDAPLQRGVAANLIAEVSRLAETGVLKGAIKKLMDAAQGKDPEKDKEAAESGQAGKPKPEAKAKETAEVKASGEAAEAEKKPKEGELDLTPLDDLDPKSQALVKDFLSSLSTALSPDAAELKELQELEKTLKPKTGQKLFDRLTGAAAGAFGVASGLVAGAVGLAVGAATGLVFGTVAGWRGVSASGTHKPASDEELKLVEKVVGDLLAANGLETKPKAKKDKPQAEAGADEPVVAADTTASDPAKASNNAASQESSSAEADDAAGAKGDDLELGGLKPGKGKSLKALAGLARGRVAKGVFQLLLAPSESSGIEYHEKIGRKNGELAGRIAGAVMGGVLGALKGALAGGGAAMLGTGFITGARARNKMGLFRPADQPKGKAIYQGRFGKEPEAPKPKVSESAGSEATKPSSPAEDTPQT